MWRLHRGSEPGAYILAVTYPDGAERIEQLDTAAAPGDPRVDDSAETHR